MNLLMKKSFRYGLLAWLGFVLCMAPVTAQGAVPDDAFLALCRTGTVEEVREAFASGANIHARDSELGGTALMWAAAGNPNPEVIKTLLEKGADINARDKAGGQALIWAAKGNSDPETIKTLLKGGADVNAQDKFGATALIFAAGCNSPEVVKALLDSGANIHARARVKNTEWTALKFAAQLNPNPKVVEELLKGGADVDSRDKYGITALMLAAGINPNPEIVRVLLENGADARAVDKGKRTVFWWAQQRKQGREEKIIQILQEYTSSARW